MSADKETQQQFDSEAVTVMFQTRADLIRDAGEMTNEDWIVLGKFVAEAAADARELPIEPIEVNDNFSWFEWIGNPLGMFHKPRRKTVQ